MGIPYNRKVTPSDDIESISVSKPGKYELDLVHLFDKKKPLVYKLADGKYVIDLASSFQKLNDEVK